MDKSMFIFVLIGVTFFYVVTDFVGSLQEDDSRYRDSSYNDTHRYDKYQGIDSVGDSLLNVSGLDASGQIGAWKSSQLKEEFLGLFPNFSVMKQLVKGRVEGSPLKEKLISLVDSVEDQYFSGTLNAEKAKQMLGTVK